MVKRIAEPTTSEERLSEEQRATEQVRTLLAKVQSLDPRLIATMRYTWRDIRIIAQSMERY